MKWNHLYVGILCSLTVAQAIAGNKAHLIYQGKIVRPDGNVVTAAAVSMTVQIQDPTSGCLLWQEDVGPVNFSSSKGSFNVRIGGGANSALGALTWDKIFQNGVALGGGLLTGAPCAGGTFTGAATDDRILYMTFNDGSGAQTVGPVSVKAVANNAMLAGVPFQGAPVTGEYLQYNGTNWVTSAVAGGGGDITDVIAGTGLTGGATSGAATLNLDVGLGASKIPQVGGTPIAGNSVVLSNGTGALTSATLSNGQLLIGSTGLAPVAANITGTANQVNVTNGAGSITLSTPQNIHSAATPTFGGMTLTGFSGPIRATAGVLSAANINLATEVTGSLPIANGGTGATTATTAMNALSPLTTKGDLIVRDATNNIRLPVGTDGQILTADSAQASGVKWAAAPSGADNLGNHTATTNVQLNGNWLSNDGGNEGIRVDNSGNVGIGVAVPLHKLHVNGDASFDGNTHAIQIKQLGTTFGYITTQGAGQNGVGIKSDANSGGRAFLLGSSDEGIVVDANGRVGIGTASPATALEVIANTGNPLLKLQNTNAAGLSGADFRDPTNSFKGYVGWSNSSNLVVFGSAAADPTTFVTNGSERIRIDATGKVGISTTTPVTKLDIAGTVKVADGGETCSIAANGGMIRYNGGNLQFCNGSSWQTLGISGAGLTSLNALTGSTQTFATGTAGADFAISSAGSVHTFNVPTASATNRGALSSADWTTFNNKLSAISNVATLNDGKIWVGDATNKAQEISLSQDVTISNAGVATIQKLQNRTLSAATPSLGTFLKYNNTLSQWEPSAFATCNGASQAMHYNSVTDVWSCDTISVTSATGTLPIANGGTGATTATAAMNALSPLTTKGDLLSRDGTDNIRLGVGTNGQILTADSTQASGIKWADAPTGSPALSAITAATATNTIDSLNFAQNWNWSTASTQSPMSISANALTTGSILNLTTSNNSLNSTNGLLNVSNTGTSTNGMVARIQANSTSGSGLTVLANGNVGVGTTSPGNLFAVKSPANGTTSAAFYNSTGSAGAFTFFHDGAGNPRLGLWDASNSQTIDIQASGTTYFNSGNVGIGTSGPAGRLEVSESFAGNSSQLYLTNSNSGANIGSGLVLRSPSTSTLAARNWGLQTNWAANGNLDFVSSASANSAISLTRMSIDSSGNVGIGTTTPGTPLDVRYNNNSWATGLRVTNPNNGANAWAQIAAVNDSSQQVDMSMLSNAAHPNPYATNMGMLRSSKGLILNTNSGVTTGGTDVLYVQTGGYQTTPTVTVTGGNPGSVGIGTTSPSTTLDVNGGITYRGVAAAAVPPVAAQGKIYYDSTANKFKVSENNGAYVDLVTNPSGIYLPLAGGTMSGDIALGGNKVTGIGELQFNVSGQIKDSSNGVMMMFTGGNTYFLAPTDLTTADGFNSTTAISTITNNDVTNGQGQGLLIKAGNGASDYPLRVQSRTASDLFTVLGNGNVGIGTASPGSSLDVSSGQIRAPSGSLAAPSLANRTNPDTGIFFEGSGSVDISIDGNHRFSVSNALMETPPVIQFDGDNSVGYQMLGADIFSIFTADTDRLTVIANGNVGIGTTAPSNTLSFDGSTDRKIAIERTASGAGADLTIQAASAQSGGTNLAGGDLILYPGTPTGNANSSIYFYSPIVGSSGSSDQTLSSTMRITNGKVAIGVGSTVPFSTLYVTGSTRFKGPSGENLYFSAGNSAAVEKDFAKLQYGYTSNTAGSEMGYVALSTMQSGTLTEGIRLNGSGNVGIGTTSPATKLDVAGTVSVSGSIESATAYVSSGAAYSIPDASVNIRRVTLSNNATVTLPTFTTPTAKVWTITVMIKQDGTGNRTLTWAAPGGDSILWDQSATAPLPASSANQVTIYQFTKPSDETTWYGSMVWKQN